VAVVREARARREAWRASRRNARVRSSLAPAAPPLPPGHLVHRVAGTADLGWFLQSGAAAAASIQEALARHGVAPRSCRILDFGCGCGRVLRHWSTGPGQLFGCDRDPQLVRWCRATLRFARVDANRLAPPLPYAVGAFDLVYALSVFTHLSEPLQQAWMDELRRVLAPGGLLLLTLHGERYRDELTLEERAAFDRGELVVRNGEDAGSNACGAYHPPAYVRAKLAAGWEVLEHVPEGARGNPYQDLVLLRSAG
jgi:SAM-dependent methyltransferase